MIWVLSHWEGLSISDAAISRSDKLALLVRNSDFLRLSFLEIILFVTTLDLMVAKSDSLFVASRIIMACFGGSSRIFRSAFWAGTVSVCAFSMIINL